LVGPFGVGVDFRNNRRHDGSRQGFVSEEFELGLSMTFCLVNFSGAHLSVHGIDDEGARAHRLLPGRSSTPTGKTDTAGEATEPAAAAGEVVLVVEDDPALRELVVELLRDLDYQVFDAADGASALKILAQTDQIDLLLSDVVLPGGMLGPDIAASARRTHPELKVMFMSGYTDGAEVNAVGSETEIEFMRKPFKLADLGQRLRRVLDR
jgi:CheY-like chemotaxis protein